MSKLRDHTAKLQEMAIEAFIKHELVRCDEEDGEEQGRWIIKRRHKDGGFESTFATEIISLMGGRLFVGGDIDDCVFGYYGDVPEHRAKLEWIGKCTDVSYYVRQKAAIGLSDSGKLTLEYDVELAKERLADWIKDTETPEDDRKLLHEARALAENQQELLDYISENLRDHELWDVGMTCSARVVYAWAACRRLCELLDERDRAKAKPVSDQEIMDLR